MIFIDFEKAFDTVNQQLMWHPVLYVIIIIYKSIE